MSIIDDFKSIYADLPENEQLKQCFADLKECIEAGLVMAIYRDGEITYIASQHYDGEAIVPMDVLEASNQEAIYGTSLN